MSEYNIDTNSIMGHVRKAIASSERSMATIVLNSLRRIRDNSPKEWDALMKTEAGGQMIALWDFLEEVEKEE